MIKQVPVNPSSTSSLTAEQKETLLKRYFDIFDAENGGWGFIHKFINADAMDYALSRAQKGGFKHGLKDSAGPYLSDSIAMTQAYLSLYQATGNQNWLEKANHSLKFIEVTFKDGKQGGFFNSEVTDNAVGVFSKPVKHRDELIQLARVANLAYHYTGKKYQQSIYQHAMKYMTSETMLSSRFFLSGLLSADEEGKDAPVHITIVGKKSDPLAQQLHPQARKYPVDYLRVDWWDKTEGLLMNNDIQYPQLDKSAAFACSADSCSLPVFKYDKLHATVDKLLQSLP